MRPDWILYLRTPRSLRYTELSGLKSFSFFLITESLTIGGLNRLSLLCSFLCDNYEPPPIFMSELFLSKKDRFLRKLPLAASSSPANLLKGRGLPSSSFCELSLTLPGEPLEFEGTSSSIVWETPPIDSLYLKGDSSSSRFFVSIWSIMNRTFLSSSVILRCFNFSAYAPASAPIESTKLGCSSFFDSSAFFLWTCFIWFWLSPGNTLLCPFRPLLAATLAAFSISVSLLSLASCPSIC